MIKITTCIQCKLYPTKYQEKVLATNSKEYIRAVNDVVRSNLDTDEWKKFTSRHIKANLSGNLRDSVKQDMKSILTTYNKRIKKNMNPTLPLLKKPILKWSYVGYGVKPNSTLRLQCWDGKAVKLLVKADILPEQYEQINSGKIGGLRITQKNGKWIAQIAITSPDKPMLESGGIMGIDLGIKVPAVAYTSDGKVKFFGNGHMNKYYRRKMLVAKQQMGRAKKLNALRNIKDKERRWMTYQDHCISKAIVDFAMENNISLIRMEKLSGIRATTSTSRKNKGYIHKWSFYRLQNFIEYKAKREGIAVEYINPYKTSQICPMCGRINKAEDRHYTCECGYKAHRDIVGAINIMRVPVIDGNSQSA